MSKNTQHWALFYLAIAGLYYVQASRKGMSPSFVSALEWPYWMVKAPSGTLNTLMGLSS